MTMMMVLTMMTQGNRSMIKAISLWIDGVSDALAAPLKPWPLDEQSILLAACKAATNGHIHVLEWLEQSPFRFNLAHPSVTKKAAEGQQQHVIEFLRRKEVLQVENAMRFFSSLSPLSLSFFLEPMILTLVLVYVLTSSLICRIASWPPLQLQEATWIFYCGQ